MHAEDHPVPAALARRLVALSMPDLAELPLRGVAGSGTDNVLYRLGRDMVVRFPRRAEAAEEIPRLQSFLPDLARQLPLVLPLVLRQAPPALGYPFGWSLNRWLTGRDAFAAPPRSLAAAKTLAQFLQRLQSLPAPPSAPTRGAADRIEVILAGLEPFIQGFETEADPAQLRRMVARAAEAPRFAGPPSWVHGDLHPLNLLTRRGALAAVIDWGGAGIGDPAMDLMAAWTMFDAPERAAFRHALSPDPGAWARGRALALAKAIMAIPYYRKTNPVFHAVMLKTLKRLLEEPDQAV